MKCNKMFFVKADGVPRTMIIHPFGVEQISIQHLHLFNNKDDKYYSEQNIR